jgi:adenylyl-sulfate kinase
MAERFRSGARRATRGTEGRTLLGADPGVAPVASVPPGERGAAVWLTGLPGAGKSSLAHALAEALTAEGTAAYVLDGDMLRTGLTSDLGYGPEDRCENVRRVAHVARILADAGIVAVVALVSPDAADRLRARALHENAGYVFVEVWVDTPLAICERRDPKGMYRRARRGDLPDFTGIDAPYESAFEADLRLQVQPLARSVDAVRTELSSRGIGLRPADSPGCTPQPDAHLTSREREVLALVELGCTNKEIAAHLSIQLGTVKNHVHHILEKLQADRRGKAVALVRAAAVERRA